MIIDINPYEFNQAEDGSLFVKEGNRLRAVSFKELSKDLESKCDGMVNTMQMAKSNSKSITEISDKLKSLVKSQFIIVFSLFELKALKGEIDVEDEGLLDLDSKVINNEINVADALDSHEFLKATYDALFGKVGK